ncbi:MAG TPA: hypothetical protein PKJ41_15475 [Bryobacteraceae bacterium]|nr:hypothetical protein [Bryobacteraceae bacterium]HPT26370.1 hypothetical protein [Bryobacteraceae bacterium]
MRRSALPLLKYWGYFAAKLAVSAGFMWLLWLGLNAALPEPDYFLRHRVARFAQDLSWTLVILVYCLLGAGLAWLAVGDQRRRCKVCLRLLRMPVERGNWSQTMILSPPEMERICPYGHGTLAEPQAHVSTRQDKVWTEHDDDIWKELAGIKGPDR